MFLLFTAENNSEKGNINSMGDALWFSLVTLSTVGYGDHFPVTIWGKVCSVVLMVGSLGLAGYVFGYVSNAIKVYMENKKLGAYGTNFSDHIIIFGYDGYANQVIDQVIDTDHQVAIVSNKKSDIELIHEHYGDNNKVFAMFMDYSHLESLEKVNVKGARTIFVNFEDDTETLVYFLNIKGYCPTKEIVVTIYNSSLKSTFINAGVTYIVCKNEISSKLVASFMFEPDVAQLTEDIMSTAIDEFDFDMIEIVVNAQNPLLNSNCFDAFMKIKTEYDAVLLGISKLVDGKWQLTKNPNKDVVIDKGDYLIMMVNGSSKMKVLNVFKEIEGKLVL
jgi:voltage-gated potassium channel